MTTINYTFSAKSVNYYFDACFENIADIVAKERSILITDDVIFALHKERFEGYKTIVMPAGEQYKQQKAVDNIIQQLIALEADRKSFIIGVGGGVVTDIVGYASSIYMRGVSVGFVPTTILAQVDAAIGGKNGVDVGIYKNLAGTIRQPDFLFYDYSFLQTLPEEQWVNGFAEIIKHACIKDAALFSLLETHSLADFRKDHQLLATLIERNVVIKSDVVKDDEFEQGDRKLLNFGHTLGHAIENEYQLLHGHAISIGMVAASIISERINGFAREEKQRVINLLEKYQLPVNFSFDKQKASDILKMDKKRENTNMNFILLKGIGEANILSIPITQLEQLIQSL